MNLTKISCISFASPYIFKMATVTGCYENFILDNFHISQQDVMEISFFDNFCISQPIFIKFALKLFLYKCLSFQTRLFLMCVY